MIIFWCDKNCSNRTSARFYTPKYTLSRLFGLKVGLNQVVLNQLSYQPSTTDLLNHNERSVYHTF